MSKINCYRLFCLIGTILCSAYPLYMAFKVIFDMTVYGVVAKEDFPKYIIPYAPISLSLLAAVVLMPFFQKKFKKISSGSASAIALIVFFITEYLFENKVIIETSNFKEVPLENWQMLSCYVNPQLYETRRWTAIDVLVGDYSPTFKLHFYLISVIIILSAVNCFYGFDNVIKNKNKTRLKALVVQTACTAIFLSMCILACFTAFFRDGEITVSPLSAVLMTTFFLLLGVTAGVYIASHLLDKKGWISLWLPAILASVVTLIMYKGEMFLLSGHLYILGKGFLFKGLPGIVLSLFDILIIVFSGVITAIVSFLLNKKTTVD